MAKRVNGSGVGVAAGLVGVAGLLAAAGTAMGQGGCEPGEIYALEEHIGVAREPFRVFVEDLDLDGNLDILTAGDTSTGTILFGS
ncbi:MAG: hypothetical protein ACIAS6_14455 [Phycisphaerales bacterium JB060]